MSETTCLRICPICEATCGLELDISGREVKAVRGDQNDIFSEGYLCPKGVAVQDLDSDPDRLRHPMIRSGNEWRKASWEEAFQLIDKKLNQIISESGRNAVSLYLGNPIVHNTSLSLYSPVLRSALRTQNVYTASSVDQIPKQLVSGLLFGNGMSIPIPDIDRCSHLLILGANPLVSNGSMMTAPNFGERLKRLQARGGKVIVIDPYKTKTAKMADEHQFIQPGSDAFLLFAMLHVLIEENLTELNISEDLIEGLEEVKQAAKLFSPEKVADRCGISAENIRKLTRDFAHADSAVIYGRIGTCTQEFGSLASWLPEVIHILTGNMDCEGGVMFTTPAHGSPNSKGAPGKGRGFKTGRYRSRVRDFPEIMGEFPVVCLSEEIETEGEGQIRAMITVAGNPVISNPNSQRIEAAIQSLDFMVSLDIYLNETTRHADVILPGLSPLENSHYDLIFSQLAIENHARYSPALFEKPDDLNYEWETILTLAGILYGMGTDINRSKMDDDIMLKLIQREAKNEESLIHGREASEILGELKPSSGPDRMIDFMLRTGPHGEGFGKNEEGISLEKLKENPHGINFGPMKPRLPEMLRTRSGKIELAPKLILEDIERLKKSMDNSSGELVLIGKRDLRSNNSWMHNIPRLVSGKTRCVMQIHPDDARKHDIQDGEIATLTSRVGTIKITALVTEDITPGVVSIPHGWGHDQSDIQLSVAKEHAGINSNILADDQLIDLPSGNAVLSGIPVTLQGSGN
jgi:anaerobic selenocysteine-containing dehydrogenase